MASYMDLLVDQSTGDLSIVDGDFDFTADSGTSLRQRLEQRFNTWKGEWPYDETFGTPYRQTLLVSGSTQAVADAAYIAQINMEDDVDAIKNLESTYDSTTRSYKMSSVEVYVTDEVINLSLVNPTADDYTYTYPTPTDEEEELFNVCEVDQDYIDQANALYKLLNIDLPETGDDTWWNLWGTDTGYSVETYIDDDYYTNEYQ